ncbi:MAG TPA: 30S ribosomal protein S9 [Nitrospiria bacterium]|nr:30S ribosomal protein S9 [Nitrospiria bacterium]
MTAVRYFATGKRKNAVARVYLEAGNGEVTVNGKPIQEYFPREAWRAIAQQPFAVTETVGRYNAVADLFGGGLSGQAGALRHGISKALLQVSPQLRERLKREGFLTRDPRVKERKKYGQKGARKRFQYSKR